MPSRGPRANPLPRSRRGVVVSCLGACLFGCASLLGVDGDFELDDTAESAAGGRGAAGERATGGARLGTGGAGAGGARATGGGSGGCSDISDCEAGEKCCNGSCVEPSTDFGCSLADCSPCPMPIPNAEALCQEQRCTGRCQSGFEPADGACVPEGQSGGATGSGGADGGPDATSGGDTGSGGEATSGGATGSGGAPAACTRETCPPCTNPLRGIIRCCDQLTDACGCSWFDLVYCVD